MQLSVSSKGESARCKLQRKQHQEAACAGASAAHAFLLAASSCIAAAVLALHSAHAFGKEGTKGCAFEAHLSFRVLCAAFPAPHPQRGHPPHFPLRLDYSAINPSMACFCTGFCNQEVHRVLCWSAALLTPHRQGIHYKHWEPFVRVVLPIWYRIVDGSMSLKFMGSPHSPCPS
jgi:hypothetical protein